MRPGLNVLSEDLIVRILDEAKKILAESGMEIRGENLKAKLLDSGLVKPPARELIFCSPLTVPSVLRNRT